MSATTSKDSRPQPSVGHKNQSLSKTVLLYRPGACALAPHIALHWTGLEHEARIADREDPAFRALSPSGAVPVLITPDGSVLSQAGALLLYIARTANRRDLLGEGVAHGQDLVEMWCSFFGSDFHPAFWPYFAAARFTTLETDEARDATKAAGVRQVKQQLAKLDAHLAGRTHFVGEANTLVDAYSVPMLRWCKNIAAVGLDDAPHVRAYYARISNDEGVRAALKVQGIEP